MVISTDRNVVLHARNVRRAFVDSNDTRLPILKGVDLIVTRGERVAIMGASGCGKTTLLQILGGLAQADDGEITLDGVALNKASAPQLDRVRNQSLGFVYQFHHLLPEFDARENVAMPLLIGGRNKPQALQDADRLLQRVGLTDRARHRPAQLSGGERQRVAIARAMVHSPAVVLADEPTGNLDEGTGFEVLSALLELNDTRDTSLVLVTHDPQVAQRMDRVLVLADGVLKPS